MDLSHLVTEQRNQHTMHLDQMSVEAFAQAMNAEDQRVPQQLQTILPQIAQAIKLITASFKQQGRLFYIGAGTSGRLGVLDAAECVPTFGTDPEMVQGLIAGGQKAMTMAVEGAEDRPALGEADLRTHQLQAQDAVVGISASGRTPYVIGGLDYAKTIGATTISIACTDQAAISAHAQLALEAPMGPEILTGSTRLKAGTAQKLILNMLSTGAMVGLGKVYKNLMVDVKPTNAKLVARSKRIIQQATGCSAEAAAKAFAAADQNVKLAIVMLLTDLPQAEANQRLQQADGFIGQAIKEE